MRIKVPKRFHKQTLKQQMRWIWLVNETNKPQSKAVSVEEDQKDSVTDVIQAFHQKKDHVFCKPVFGDAALYESNVLAFAFYAPKVLMSTYEGFKKYYRENIRLYNT